MKENAIRVFLCLLVSSIALFLFLTPVCMAKDKPIKLLVGVSEPENSPWAKPIKAWGRELEEATKGRVKTEISFGGALGKTGQMYDLTRKGIVDVAFDIPAFSGPGIFPMSDIIGLPYILKSGEMTCKAMLEWSKLGYLDKEYSEVKLLHISFGMGVMYYTKKIPITKVEHLKGLKIWAPTPPEMAKIKALGGVPVAIPPSEIYIALQKGIVDGILLEWGGLEITPLHEQLKYATPMNDGTVMINFIMNKKKFNSLPPDAKAMIDGTREKYSLALSRGWDEFCVVGKKKFLDGGGKILEWEAGEIEKIHSVYPPIWEAWIKDREKRGLPAIKAVEDLYRINAGLGVDPPAIGYKPGS